MARAPKGSRKAAGGASANKTADKSPLIDKTVAQEHKTTLDKVFIKEIVDQKQHKDFKDHKDHKDFKDHKDIKNEIKELKDHKHEWKENKNEKAEIDIQFKREPDFGPPTPWKHGDPLPDGLLGQWAMMTGMGTAEHFIKPEDRPDLGEGALAGESDKAKPKR